MIDTHCHLNFPELKDDLPQIIARAKAAGVERFLVPGTEKNTSESALELAKQYPQVVFASVGVHPSDAKDLTAQDLDGIRKLASDPDAKAIGEVGLDYFHQEGIESAGEWTKRKEAQKALFSQMIALAQIVQKPLILHTRDSYSDARAMLKSEAKGLGAVVHCFTGDYEQAKAWLDLGYMISLTGILTYKKNSALREAVAKIPLDSIMLETDAPYLPPEGFRGKLGEPMYVASIAQCLVEVKGATLEKVASTTTANAERFFSLTAHHSR